MKINGYNAVVESSGFVIDENNFILGCTPDGKVLCDGEYGIIEIKCPEQYSNVDPKDICFISKNPFLIFEAQNNKVKINKEHSYYKQIQMQLALTTQTWCDFICYTSKGLVIDRVNYDESFWSSLREDVLKFYFDYMLDEIVTKI